MADELEAMEFPMGITRFCGEAAEQVRWLVGIVEKNVTGEAA